MLPRKQRSEFVERVLNIFGQPTTIADHDESRYLAGASTDYEPDTLAVFAAFCEPRFNVLDVGANIGLTAIALGRLCSRGKVFAIEASPETYGYLKSNVARARLANVTCENMAASSASGHLNITFTPSCSAGGFISQKYQIAGYDYRHYTVRACAIDEYLRTTGVSHIDFIKADVEGFEIEVLRGARQTIERCRPVIYCEVNHWCLNIFRRLPLPDFIEELFTFCPHLFAVDADLQYLDLSDRDSLHKFYHDHTTRLAYMNLICGFDKRALVAKLDTLPGLLGVVPAGVARAYEPEPLSVLAAYCRRRLRALKRYLQPAA
jgi:FkbM family methyltransferase